MKVERRRGKGRRCREEMKETVRETVCEGEEALGQCVLNDHLRKQACKFGSELKKA